MLILFFSLLIIQGDLGAIDEKYDVAISTACGALDNIIVDTMDTAVQCVDFLRKQDVGVATFIGLDKMERWKKEAHSKITTYVKFVHDRVGLQIYLTFIQTIANHFYAPIGVIP